MKKLVGKTITKIELDNSDSFIRFHCSDGETLTYECYADCCSEGWIEHISNLESLLGQTVTEVRELDSISVFPTSQESDILYAVEIKTPRRVPFMLEFRNSSNGYYGSCIWEAGKYSWDNEPGEFRELTEDF